jgi:hypothetical protein
MYKEGTIQTDSEAEINARDNTISRDIVSIWHTNCVNKLNVETVSLPRRFAACIAVEHQVADDQLAVEHQEADDQLAVEHQEADDQLAVEHQVTNDQQTDSCLLPYRIYNISR